MSRFINELRLDTKARSVGLLMDSRRTCIQNQNSVSSCHVSRNMQKEKNIIFEFGVRGGTTAGVYLWVNYPRKVGLVILYVY